MPEEPPNTSFHAKHIRQLVKTEMCKYFLKNKCTKGPCCPYGHSLMEIREKPNLNCTSMCRSFLRTGNCDDPNCTFAHSERQLRTTAGFFKTKLCRFAAKGRCKHGTTCRFAHCAEELTPQDPQQAVPHRAGSSDDTSVPTGGSGESSIGQRTGGSGESSSGGDQSNQGEPTDQSPPAVWQTMAHYDWADTMSDPSESTRAETAFSVATPEGSGDSGQEEPAAASFHNPPWRNGNTDERTRRSDRQAPAVGRPNKVSRCTTMMITNVPNFLTQGALVSLFEDLTICMRGTFDFFYCPWDPYQDRNLGHAIINFYSKSIATHFERQWADQLLLPRTPGQKRLRIVPAALQGRAANLRHFSGFSLAHHTDPRFRPLVRAAPNEMLRPMSISEEFTNGQQGQDQVSGMEEQAANMNQNDVDLQGQYQSYGQPSSSGTHCTQQMGAGQDFRAVSNPSSALQPRRDLLLNLLSGSPCMDVGRPACPPVQGCPTVMGGTGGRCGMFSDRQRMPQGMPTQPAGINVWNGTMGAGACPFVLMPQAADGGWMGDGKQEQMPTYWGGMMPDGGDMGATIGGGMGMGPPRGPGQGQCNVAGSTMGGPMGSAIASFPVLQEYFT